MPITLSELDEQLCARKYPRILTQDELSILSTFALREMNISVPVTAYSTFTTTPDVFDYRIFDTSDTTTSGFASGSQFVSNIYWNPSGDFTTLDIFNPGWQIIQHVIESGVYFHQPSQMMILRQKLEAWRNQFGMQAFEIVGRYGDPDAVLRLYPVPTAEATVIVEYKTGGGLSDLISDIDFTYFWQWMDYYVADTMSNYYAQSAGVELLGFETGTDALKYWERRAEKKLAEARDRQRGAKGQVLRT